MARHLNRREILTGSLVTLLPSYGRNSSAQEKLLDYQKNLEELNQILKKPVLNVSILKSPLIIESIDLLRLNKVYLLRIGTKDGIESFSVPHSSKMQDVFPLFLRRIAPFFVGKDARNLETLLEELYRYQSNYKLQGLAFWVGVAAIEMGILELLCKAAEIPIANLFGKQLKTRIPVYYASGNRGNTPAHELKHLTRLVEQSGVKALKFRVGGRMSKNKDSLEGRSETLIPLVRKEFGDKMVLYADSNSSYDVKEAIRIGRLMEVNNYGFFEEPCEFDDLWSTKNVANLLEIPIAGGEQEYSLHRWKWMIANRALDIVQPDLHYGGGFIRATKVARMAESAGMKVVPHMSGGGLDYLHVAQFASFTPNIGDYMEFKGSTTIPVTCETSSLMCKKGVVTCPTGIGFGVTIEKKFIRSAKKITI